MDNISSNDKLDRLKQLLIDYSFPEKINEGMLRDIDKLLTWAIQTFVAPGASLDQVRSHLGDPFVEIGDAVASDWLYPCLSPDEHSPSTDFDGIWYYDLHFKDHSLVSITKRKWRFTK